MVSTTQQHRGTKESVRMLTRARGMHGETPFFSFNFQHFQDSILANIPEIQPSAIWSTGSAADAIAAALATRSALSGQLDKIEREIIEGGEVGVLARASRQIEKDLADVDAEIAELRRKIAGTTAEAWGEASSLLKALQSAEDKEGVLLRIRAAFRSSIAGIWCVMGRRDGSNDKFCVAQIHFVGSEITRTCVIWYRPGVHHRPPCGPICGSAPLSWASCDLRNPSIAKGLYEAVRLLPFPESGTFGASPPKGK